jgi:hypothetical protein
LIIGKSHHHSCQVSLQRQTVLPFGFALEVPLELASTFNLFPAVEVSQIVCKLDW